MDLHYELSFIQYNHHQNLTRLRKYTQKHKQENTKTYKRLYFSKYYISNKKNSFLGPSPRSAKGFPRKKCVAYPLWAVLGMKIVFHLHFNCKLMQSGQERLHHFSGMFVTVKVLYKLRYRYLNCFILKHSNNPEVP